MRLLAKLNFEHKCWSHFSKSIPISFLYVITFFFLDIDECSTFSHNCSQLCQNIEGGHKCYCVEGYRIALDNKTCHCKSTKCSYRNIAARSGNIEDIGIFFPIKFIVDLKLFQRPCGAIFLTFGEDFLTLM